MRFILTHVFRFFSLNYFFYSYVSQKSRGTEARQVPLSRFKKFSRSKEFNVTSRMRPSNRGIDNAIKNSLLDSLIKSLGCSAEFVITCWKFAAAFAHTFAALYSCTSLHPLSLSLFLSLSSRISRRPRLHLPSSQRPRVSLFRQFPRTCRRQMPTSPSFSI